MAVVTSHQATTSNRNHQEAINQAYLHSSRVNRLTRASRRICMRVKRNRVTTLVKTRTHRAATRSNLQILPSSTRNKIQIVEWVELEALLKGTAVLSIAAELLTNRIICHFHPGQWVKVRYKSLLSVLDNRIQQARIK